MSLAEDRASGTESPQLVAALWYAQHGWKVFPIYEMRDGACSCGDKDPKHKRAKHPRNGNGLTGATIDEGIIWAWWQKWPDANVGIRTGAGLLVLDVDPRHDGDQSLAELEQQHGKLPPTVEVKTGGGGRHLYFRVEGQVHSKNGVRDGIDIKCDGGYVIAPGSNHESGGTYEWEVSGHPDEVAMAPAPEWLVGLVAKPKSGHANGETSAKIPQGSRNDKLTSLAGSMRHRGFAPAAIEAALRAENQERGDPPLDEKEVESIATGILRYPPGLAATEARRVIRHEPSTLSPSVYGAIEALSAQGAVYVSGARLVQVTRATAKDAERSTWKDSEGRTRYGVQAGSPQVTPIAPAVLKLRISEVARFERYVRTRAAWEPCAPPDDVVGAVHELRDWDLPPLVGVAETPILRPDGTIANARGYDPVTGYWIAPSAAFPDLREKPTRDDAVKAYAALAEVFADFPFACTGQSSVPIAGVLTVLARAYLQRASVPGILCDAGAGGVGKTLLTDAIAAITTGRPASRKAYPATDEECEKVLAAYALRGASFISIDDVKRPLGGENLDRVLTARGEVDFRKLGKTELVTMPWRALLAFSGVIVRFIGQMARRLLIARIESRLERPQDRADFKHPELLSWIAKNRAGLVVAALTVLRAYLEAEAPDMKCKRWGSFEEWSRLIPHAIAYAGGTDVLTFRAPDDDEDMVEDVSNHRVVLAGLEKLCLKRAPHYHRNPGDGLTSGEVANDLFKMPCLDHAPLREALRALVGAKGANDPTPTLLGVHLAKLKGRPLRVTDEANPKGRILRLAKVKDTHKGGADRWTVEDISEAG